MKYSVIDISSSSISLIIAEADERKTEIIFKDRISVSLLHYLDGKTLTERGTEKLIDALKTMKDECERFGVRYCYLISTAALRVIANCDEVSRISPRGTSTALEPLGAKRLKVLLDRLGRERIVKKLSKRPGLERRARSE